MRNSRQSWLRIFVLAAGAILIAGHQEPAKAFTLIERLLLPAVQLVDGQSAAIKVTNVSPNTITVELQVYTDTGTLLLNETKSIATGATYTLEVKAPPNAPLSFRAAIGSNTPNAALADAMAFDIKTGEAIVLVPAVQLNAQ